MLNTVTKREKIRAAMIRIGAQFPDGPEARLMLEIINRAALDLMNKTYKCNAERYLRNAIHAEVCGVSPVWVRETFETMGIIPKL